MKRNFVATLCCCVLGAGVARAQDGVVTGGVPDAVESPQAVQPPAPPPDQAPPPPPSEVPPPPVQQPEAQTIAPGPGGEAGGQWVYTSQYGWVWMPYGTRYTYEGTAADTNPYAYVYYPSYGWTWLVAPWVWGWGTYPYFGVFGASHFAWYRGLYRAGYGWGRYRGGSPGAFRSGYGGGWRGYGGGWRGYGGGYSGGYRGGYGSGGYRGGSFPAARSGGYTGGRGWSGGGGHGGAVRASPGWSAPRGGASSWRGGGVPSSGGHGFFGGGHGSGGGSLGHRGWRR
jgi:hypothetical protein